MFLFGNSGLECYGVNLYAFISFRLSVSEILVIVNTEYDVFDTIIALLPLECSHISNEDSSNEDDNNLE